MVDYIHAGGKLGVLVEAACDSAAASGTEAFRTTVRDIAMHIAATNPLALKREELSSELVQREREIYIKQTLDSDKPQQIAEKMVMKPSCATRSSPHALPTFLPRRDIWILCTCRREIGRASCRERV